MVDSVCKVATRPRNSKAEMVMEGSDVVGATGETVGVIGRATETALGMGTGGAKVGDSGVGGIVFVRSSPYSIGTGVDCAYSVCEGSRGATMEGAPEGAE